MRVPSVIGPGEHFERGCRHATVGFYCGSVNGNIFSHRGNTQIRASHPEANGGRSREVAVIPSGLRRTRKQSTWADRVNRKLSFSVWKPWNFETVEQKGSVSLALAFVVGEYSGEKSEKIHKIVHI
jgi:hypothetical protein